MSVGSIKAGGVGSVDWHPGSGVELPAGPRLVPVGQDALGTGQDAPRRRGPYRPTASVSVVIPALNEEGSIGWVLEHLPKWVSQVVLVDGLSTDRTEAVGRAICPEIVVVHQARRGKGAALRAGFAAATGDIVVMIDADGSTDPREMGRFVQALEAGADFVKGSRHLAGGGSVDFTRVRLAGNRGFVLLANALFGQRFTDLCYGYCGFWRCHVPTLALTADGFEIETQLVLNAVKAGLAIVEVPSVELERRAGSSNLHALPDGRRVLGTMWREWRAPLIRVGVERVSIALYEVRVAPHDSDAWLPAGHDRRRAERRRPDDATVFERRAGDRRTQPAGTSVILRVSEVSAEATDVMLTNPTVSSPSHPRVLSPSQLPGDSKTSTVRGAGRRAGGRERSRAKRRRPDPA